MIKEKTYIGLGFSVTGNANVSCDTDVPRDAYVPAVDRVGAIRCENV